MEKPEIPTITSFVIRFIQEDQQPVYRGTIHHVQSSLEIPFTHWQDAVEFIQRFVSIDFEQGDSPNNDSLRPNPGDR